MNAKKRPRLDARTEIAVWASAAGRCTFCNRLVLENDDLGLIVPIGELAHNVGWSQNSPRGSSLTSSEERSRPENLFLLCRNCHKPADDRGVVGCYSTEVLRTFKRQHEDRIRFLTEIGADRKALVIRLIGSIHGKHPELTYDTVLAATTAAGIFPATLPNAYRNAIEIDLREFGEGTPEIFEFCTSKIHEYLLRIDEGIKRDKISRLALLPATSEPDVISSPAAWANFERIMRHFLAHIEKEHGKLSHIAIFPAVPLSCAIILGRVLMPQVSPALVLFERNEQRTFFQALEVKR